MHNVQKKVVLANFLSGSITECVKWSEVGSLNEGKKWSEVISLNEVPGDHYKREHCDIHLQCRGRHREIMPARGPN